MRTTDQDSTQSRSAEKRARLASLLRQTVAAATPPADPPAAECGTVSPLPLSFVQRRLWFFDQLAPGASFHNVAAALWIEGALDVGALERSLNALVRLHDSLRTTFSVEGDQLRQSVSEAAHFVLPVVDLGHLGEPERDAEARRIQHEEVQRPFDLARGPLFRSSLVRLTDGRHLLLATAHHAVCDGWSAGVLLGDLAALYGAFASGQPSPLRDRPAPYADFIRWEQSWIQGEMLQSHLTYWKHQLHGAKASLDLPTDWPRPAVQGFRGERQAGGVSGTVLTQLKALCRSEGVTLFMTLLAAFYTLLFRYTAETDIVVGTPVAGRPRSEMERTIGCFVNLLALRADLSGNPTFIELLRRVRQVALAAYAHQDVPFDKLIEDLRPSRVPGRPPLFQIMLNMTNYADAWAFSAPGLEVRLLDRPEEPAMYDLTLYATELPEGIQMRVVYNADLFAPATVEQLMRRLEGLIASVASDPHQRIGALPLAGAGERARLAGAFAADLEDA